MHDDLPNQSQSYGLHAEYDEKNPDEEEWAVGDPLPLEPLKEEHGKDEHSCHGQAATY